MLCECFTPCFGLKTWGFTSLLHLIDGHAPSPTIRKQEYEYTLAFVGYGEETDSTVLELTYNWGDNTYDKGNAYGHIAIEVDNIYQFCENLEANGAEVYRKPGPVKGGSTVIAFVRDPDGYAIELIQNKSISL